VNEKDYVEKRTKAVDSLIKDPTWTAMCSEAGAALSRRQARKYLLHRGKTYRYEQARKGL